MLSESGKRLEHLLENLTGQSRPLIEEISLQETVLNEAANLIENGNGIGYSQFNEILLLLGYDRVEVAFFEYLAIGSAEVQDHASTIKSLDQLEYGIDVFRKLALLEFGNVKFGFKKLSRESGVLWDTLEKGMPYSQEDFCCRHSPILPVNEIDGTKSYYLGYLIEKEISRLLEKDPSDSWAIAEEQTRLKIIEMGKINHSAYLASDHLDIYVATSMRERHEYLLVNQLIKEIFAHPALDGLKLRWFDPTQAYCRDRIDKGLAEGLMLKRAKCTLYFAQETDTIGKDSELASTLAQGKPVVAFVPTGDAEFAERLIKDMKVLYPDKGDVQRLLDMLKIFESSAPWDDEEIRGWLKNRDSIDVEVLKRRLVRKIREHYDKRAATLRDVHPLGIQVCLSSGVANGVMVVRKVEDCAKILRAVVLNQLEFRLESHEKNADCLLLKEVISNSVFRVMSGDKMLTNAFWNYYI